MFSFPFEGQMWCNRVAEMSKVGAGRRSERINAVALSHAASFAIMTLSTNCQSTQTSEGFCFLSWRRCRVCHAKNSPSLRLPWRRHMAGRQQYGETVFLWTSRSNRPPTPSHSESRERLETQLNQPWLEFSLWIKKYAGDDWRTYSKTHTKKVIFSLCRQGFLWIN